MMRLIEVFDRQRKRVAVLQNAYNVREKHVLNGVGELTFSLPEGDEKAKYLQPRRYVRYDGGEVYRILEMQVDDDGAPVISVTCEHAPAWPTACSIRIMCEADFPRGKTSNTS